MAKLRKISIMLTIVVSTFAPASLLAQRTAPTLPNETVSITRSEEAELQNQPQQSDQALRPLPPPENRAGEQRSASQNGTIMGTITDLNDGPVSGALVTLEGSDSSDVRSVTTNENGFYEMRDVEAGRAYKVKVNAAGFSEWDSPELTINPGHSEILDVTKLRIEEVQTSVTVTPESSDQIAIQQVKTEEKQRGFGIIPNFYAVYASDPAPLNTRLKFRLALRVARDPYTFAGVTMLAGIGQTTDHPDYVQGAKGFGERLGANYANSFTDIMFEGAIFPSLLHQDPRYFYKGAGTKKARVAHVLYSLIATKGDNGKWQPDYSGLGGNLLSAAISNAYYPRTDRGVGLVFQGFGTVMAEHIAIRMLDEFVFRPAKGNVAN
jgi:Carboxypeptidase regulatory-like domain